MLLLAHPTGNANVRAAARAFHSANLLQELHSCICWNSHSRISSLLSSSWADHLARRSFAGVPLKLQHSHPWREVMRLLGPRLPGLRRHESGPLSIDAVYRSFDRHVAASLPKLSSLSAVYAYEDGALHSFRAARRLGLTTIYELPTGYWREARLIHQEEQELQPSWAPTLTGLKDSPDKLARKDEELRLADQVIIPSSFVRATLLRHQVCSAPVAMLPYGSPIPIPELKFTPRGARPLRVLFVGTLGQAKGLSYALEAVESLGPQVGLTLIGIPKVRHCPPLDVAIQRHRHIPSLPHAQILEQMRQHDVLIFPSLFDGFGLVITEALSQGLPVIATANSGAPECIRDGVEGFIVPIRNSQAIAERLQQLVDHPDQLTAMRQACLRRAAELSWAGYERALVDVVSRVLALQASTPA